jgi:hypothetical protein
MLLTYNRNPEEAVKSSFVQFFIIGVCVAALGVSGKDETKGQTPDGQQSKVRIGVIGLDVTGGDAAFADKINDDVLQALNDIGFYKVYGQRDIETAFAGIKQKFPSRCRDPRCVVAIGSALGFDRMLYGRLDKNNTRYGTMLVLLDVQTTQVSQRVTMETEPGAAPTDLVKAAILKLHGLSLGNNALKTRAYFGPEVRNGKQPLYSSAGVLALAALWAAANGSFKDIGSTTMSLDTFNMSGKSASPLLNPPAGRAAAMGGCYVAASDDAYGVLFNPAGMAWVPNMDVAIGYQYRYDHLGMKNGVNMFNGAFANKATREFGFGHALFYIGDYEHMQNELYFLSSYAYKFNQLLPFLRPISIGATLKIIQKTTPVTDNSSTSQNTLGAGLDIGFMTELADHIRLGVVFKDVPTVEKVNSPTGRYVEYYPPLLLIGGSYQVGYSTFLICEGQIPLKDDQPWKFAGGIEQDIWQVFFVRAGLKREVVFDSPWLITAGFATKINLEWIGGKYVIIDGAYEYNTNGLFPVENISFRVGF